MAAFDRIDDLFDLIDRGQLKASSHAVASHILRSLKLNDPLYQTLLSIHETSGRLADMAEVQKQLWRKIDSAEPGSDGWLRLAVVLTLADEVIDSHLAEYFEYWAEQQGLSEHQIIAAFQFEN